VYASQTSHRGNSYLALNAQTQGVTPNSALNPDTNPTTVAVAEVGTGASNKLANPSISMLPTGGDDDDEDKEGDDD